MKKNITIIGINYAPEDSAIGLYTTQKAEYLVSKGYDVSVITGFPYYPQWEISNEYKSKSYLVKEIINGVHVFRNKQYVPKDPTFFKRLIHLISFTIGNFINLFRVPKPVIVIAIIPFTTSAFLGWLLKLRYNAKLWVHIQDFEFDAAIDAGLLSGNKKTIINSLQWIEKKVLKKATIVSTISYGMLNKLKEKTAVPTYYLTNWIDVSLFDIDSKEKHKYLKSDKFKILYSGNIGAKQDWGFFFKVLEELKLIDNIEVIIVGEGAEKLKVVKETKQYDFVKHYNLVPYKELPSLLLSADLQILFQKNEVIDTVMPSKLLGMMASGKPSIVTGNLNSEVAKIFSDSKCGNYSDGTSVDVIIEQINNLKANKTLSNRMGTNGRKYIYDAYSKQEVLEKFNIKLKSI